MGKEKEVNYSCPGCGFECEKEQQLINHCNAHHIHEPMVLYNAIGKFANIDHATTAYKKLNIDFQSLNMRIENLTKENKRKDEELLRLSKAINIYNEAAHGVTHTMSLLASALEPYQYPKS